MAALNNYDRTNLAPDWQAVMRARPALNWANYDIQQEMRGNIVSDPVIRVYSSGLRNIPDSAEFRAAAPGWNTNTGRFENVLDANRAQLRDGSVWQLNANGVVFELEHYFECRFAGRVYVACCTGANADNTSVLALALLDRLVNKASNIAWTAGALNAMKTAYFTGRALNTYTQAEQQGLLNYLNAAREVFSRLITQLIQYYGPRYPVNSAILKMLKCIALSPFSGGGPTWNVALASNNTAWIM